MLSKRLDPSLCASSTGPVSTWPNRPRTQTLASRPHGNVLQDLFRRFPSPATKQADALIADAYLCRGPIRAGCARRSRLCSAGAVGKDTVSRVWRKVKGDWDAWNALLKDEPIIRLILDGTVVRVRLSRALGVTARNIEQRFKRNVQACGCTGVHFSSKTGNARLICAPHLKTPNARPSHGAKFDYRSSAAEFAFICGGGRHDRSAMRY